MKPEATDNGDFAEDSLFLDSFCLDEVCEQNNGGEANVASATVLTKPAEMEGSDPVFESPSLVRTPGGASRLSNGCQTPDSARSDRLAVRRRQTQRALRSHSKISPGPILSDSESESKDTPVRAEKARPIFGHDSFSLLRHLQTLAHIAISYFFQG